ncbi:Acetate CoA-transferase YdiF [Propionicimonas sp. T2.31MG-18]|uniref:acyl CoA:acetate/3-ketoacid CoA transferase n=1 Tax=Propionicimonas sp. T2.31MG-18 TaxID=3157620 RepID=UPI0035E4B6A0
MPDFRTSAQAARLIPDEATLLVDGSGGGVNDPDLFLREVERRFLTEGAPRDLTIVHVSGMGDAKGGGIDRLAHEGLVKRVIGGHWAWSPRMQRLAVEERIEAYCLPQGTLSHLLRAVAGGRPGVISQVGLGTTVDPRQEGGRLNASASEDLVEVIELAGQEWLFTKAFPIDVAVIRGSQADELGNISMADEGLLAETLSAAQAARNSGGIVIAQVRERVAAMSLPPRSVRVPGVLVDVVVEEPEQRLSHATRESRLLTGQAIAAASAAAPMPLGVRKVIARRATEELCAGDVVNLGFGMPDGVANVLAEERLSDQVVLTVEQGHVGGMPVGGSDFGMAINPWATLDAGHQFDWYDGGGLDLAVLSFAQVDSQGNVNVGRFNNRISGVGGFINISQGARRVIFVGTAAVGADISVDGMLGVQVRREGAPKFVDAVEQISFSGRRALETHQEVLYVTERGVFQLDDEGLRLVEIAPGVDLERDLLPIIGARFRVDEDLRIMNSAYFHEAPIGWPSLQTTQYRTC